MNEKEFVAYQLFARQVVFEARGLRTAREGRWDELIDEGKRKVRAARDFEGEDVHHKLKASRLNEEAAHLFDLAGGSEGPGWLGETCRILKHQCLARSEDIKAELWTDDDDQALLHRTRGRLHRKQAGP